MNQPSDAVLEFAAILGEAVARVHLAKQAETRNANARDDVVRGVCVGSIVDKGDSNDDKCTPVLT